MKTSDTDHHDSQTENAISAFKILFPGQSMPDSISTPGGAQFAVTSGLVRRTSLDQWVAFRDWLIETPLSSMDAGGAFEFFWHIIFLGTTASNLCPDEAFCYCQLYGMCLDPELRHGTTKQGTTALSELRDLENRRSDVKLERDLLKYDLKTLVGDKRRVAMSRLISIEEKLQEIETTFATTVADAFSD